MTLIGLIKMLIIKMGIIMIMNKLDGVGPVDNTPSTDYLNHFVRQKNKNTCVTQHLTYDM